MITVSRALFLLRARERAFIKHVRYDVSVRDRSCPDVRRCDGPHLFFVRGCGIP